jgi:hypothetical protein
LRTLSLLLLTSAAVGYAEPKYADRGHPQVIAGYYDGDLSNFRKWDTASKGGPGVRGFMYTTWAHNFGLLEEYGKAIAETK